MLIQLLLALLTTAIDLPPRCSFFPILSQSDYFHLELNCSILTTQDCKQVQSTTNGILAEISNELVLKVPITIKIEFQNFTTKGHKYSMIRSLQPLSIPARRSKNGILGPKLAYPSMLAKQTTPYPLPIDLVNKIQSYNPYDLHLEFNSELDWAFTNISLIPPYRLINYDQKLSLHLTKALGMASNLQRYYKGWPDLLQLGPKIISSDGKAFFSGDGSWVGFLQYPSPFDSLIQTPRTTFIYKIQSLFKNTTIYEKLIHNVEKLSPFLQQNSTLPQIESLLNNQKFKKYSKKLYKSMQYKPVLIVSNETIDLDRSTIGALGKKYYDTSDFLLSAKRVQGYYYDPNPLRNFHKMKSILGSYTLKILSEIGYSTRSKPQNLELVYEEEDEAFWKSWSYLENWVEER